MSSKRPLASGLVIASTLLAVACGSGDVPSSGLRSGGKSGTGNAGFGGEVAKVDDGNGGECAATVAEAEKAKVDIIFVIDDSGSMTEEMTQIKTNVNRFADKIEGIGLDYRVLFIVRKGTSGNTICVPAPLAGANCADNAPKFFHINQDVQSNDSLDLILSTYDGTATQGQFPKLDPNGGTTVAPWKDKVRADATKIFVEVTDDESNMSAEAFDTALLAKDNGMFGTAQARKYIFHSIVSKPSTATAPSTALCPTAAGTSVQYQKLSILTGGLIDEVCKTDYSSVLDNIAKGIVDKLGCELGYPKADSADPTKVAVRYTPSGGSATNLTQVTDASKCASVKDGWYYDDPKSPSKIVLCKTACDAANGTPGTKIEALVGCTTPAPR